MEKNNDQFRLQLMIFTDNDCDDISISAKAPEDIWDRSQIHPEINARDDRSKISDCHRKTQDY